MGKGEVQRRKQRHLDICLDKALKIESGNTHLGEISIPYRPLPEIDTRLITTGCDFLNHALRIPVMISCMTGGSDEGRKLNRILASVASEAKIAIGTGSIRVMLNRPETRSHFQLKKIAPNAPVLANIGVAQLREFTPEALMEAVSSIEADGLCVHLNSSQEFFQEHGERDFSGWYEGFERLMRRANIPVLVKETGAGIPPVEGLRLLKLGVSFVDIAGSGGTDWVVIEGHRNDSATQDPRHSPQNHGDTPRHLSAAHSFRDWGYSTGELLIAYRQIAETEGKFNKLVRGRIIASGGLRTPRDFAISIACGAHIAAAALPFIRIASDGGPNGVFEYLAEITKGIQAALALSGSKNLDELRRGKLRISPRLHKLAKILVDEIDEGKNSNDFLEESS